MATAAPQEAHPTPVRKIYDRETVTRHIGNNLIRKTPESLRGRKCGDGRDTQGFMEAIFGADLGYVFATQSALRSMGKIQSGQEAQSIDAILTATAGDGTIFTHTDNHPGNEETLIGGCGANGVARRNLQAFGLTQEDISAMDAVLAQKNSEGKLEKAVYKGGHIEGAVLVVNGRDFGVRAMDEKNNSSVFVLQVDLIKDRFAQIAHRIAPQYGVTEGQLIEKMMEMWTKQTDIIGGELAHLPDGTPLPKYQVNFDTSGRPVIV